MYRSANGVHPLLRFWVENNRFDNINFVYPDTNKLSLKAHLSLIPLAYRLSKDIFKHGNKENLNTFWISKYCYLLRMGEQLHIQKHSKVVDAVFHHTVPFNQSEQPWILHFESPTPLFFPFIYHGEVADIELENQLIYKIVKEKLAAENCLGIFSHIKESVETLKTIFNDEDISKKIHYIPAGVAFPKQHESAIKSKIEANLNSKPITFLFTNSFHGDPASFCLRGGLEVLNALGKLAEKFNIRVKIFSKKPNMVPPTARFNLEPRELQQFLPESLNEKIEWHEARVSDEILDQALVESDFFLLPSAGLHSMAAMKALAFGCCVVVSDAPGFDEFITDGENGIVIKGRRKAVYQRDVKTGWYRDNYKSMYELQQEIADQLYKRLLYYIVNQDERRQIMKNAVERIKRDQTIDAWVNEFTRFVHEKLRSSEKRSKNPILANPTWNFIEVDKTQNSRVFQILILVFLIGQQLIHFGSPVNYVGLTIKRIFWSLKNSFARG